MAFLLIIKLSLRKLTFPRILFQISKEYESEIFQIQRDIQKFRDENEALKQKLEEVFHANNDNEHQNEPSSPHSTDAISEFRNNYIYFTDEIFNNFRNQLQLLCQVSSKFK